MLSGILPAAAFKSKRFAAKISSAAASRLSAIASSARFFSSASAVLTDFFAALARASCFCVFDMGFLF